jgi:quercetin dioxygenase-like cupin family protein
MNIKEIPFGTTSWNEIQTTHHPGLRGHATWRTRKFGDLRVRMVEYSPGYEANHWCNKGHILLCLSGELRTELQDGSVVELTAGMSYQVGDDVMPHRSTTRTGASLFIVD